MILRFRIAFITTILCSICSALDVHCDAVGSMGRSAVMLQTETGDVQKVQHIGEKDKAIPVQVKLIFLLINKNDLMSETF
ncbi:unnamed protein product [Durusdinium trenchii]|uniref:Uncharacterized protein n=1 Tax=Durusdinium trenchii TaxID=1381693 RepID=A0ABP0RV96_9DINO